MLAWDRLSGYTDAQRAEYLRAATPILLAGQGRAIDLTLASLSALLEEPQVPRTRAPILAAARIDLSEPFIALGRALAAGNNFDAAVTAGRLRAGGIGESGVYWASRAANKVAESDERVVGWRRVITTKACDWCRTISTQRYRSVDSASFGHLRCDCSVEPIIGDRDPGRVINASTR